MFNFFADENSRRGDEYVITGGDYNHIVNVLRMKKGERLIVSDGASGDLCAVEDICDGSVTLRIIEEGYKKAELPVKIYLFQALPKSDKMELIIQKAVELGVYAIVPTQMKRCVVKLDDKKKESRRQRWQAIAESAAKQSKRNIIPEVYPVMTYGEMLKKAKELDLFLVPYENEMGMAATKDALSRIKSGMSVGILIGSEGGFEISEIEKAQEAGGLRISLGGRILRTETAAITAVSMCMLYTEMNTEAEE